MSALCSPVRVAVAMLWLTACPRATEAADSAGNYAIWGAGGRSCHQFLNAAVGSADLATFGDYLMGYLTAANTIAPDTYDAVGGDSLEVTLASLKEYCAGHKIESFERALSQLLDAHRNHRSRQPPGATRGWGGSNSGPVSSP